VYRYPLYGVHSTLLHCLHMIFLWHGLGYSHTGCFIQSCRSFCLHFHCPQWDIVVINILDSNKRYQSKNVAVTAIKQYQAAAEVEMDLMQVMTQVDQ
jgi:hypothetical protein